MAMLIRKANEGDIFPIGRVQVESNRSTYVGIMPGDYLNSLSYESKAIESNVNSMILWTLQDNPSSLFYKKLGGKFYFKNYLRRYL
jgi:hypothetical protein